MPKKYTPTGRPVGRPKNSKNKYPSLKDSWTQGLRQRVAPEPIREQIRNFGKSDLPSNYNTDKIVSKRINILRTETMHSMGFGKKGLSTTKAATVRRSFRKGVKAGESKAVYSGFLLQLQKESLGALLAAGVRGTKNISITKSKLSEAIKNGILEFCRNNVHRIQEEMIYALREETKAGKLYLTVFKNNVVYLNHRASAVGQSPAVLSGEFVNSYKNYVWTSGAGLPSMEFTNTAPYAEELHKMGRDLFPINPATDPTLYTTNVSHQILSGAFGYLNNRYQYFTRGIR